MAAPFIRDPLPIPHDGSSGRDRVIRFRHPGYSSGTDLLFALPRVDSVDEGRKGVHHRTALAACQILANNAFDGRLYHDKDAKRLVEVAIDDILTEFNYYFIPDPNNPGLRYPIVPSFQDWTFPHESLGDFWPAPPIVNVDPTGERRCVLTNHNFGLKTAHIVPKEEAEWFAREGMHTYGGVTIDNSRNLMPMRADIHKSYDGRRFSIVPKREITRTMAGTLGRPTYVVHFIGIDVGELWGLYHNVPLQRLQSTSMEYHFARFAWAIFLLVKPFIVAGRPRQVVRYEGEALKEEELAGPVLRDLYGGGGSVSASPMAPIKKRKVETEEEGGSGVDD